MMIEAPVPTGFVGELLAAQEFERRGYTLSPKTRIGGRTKGYDLEFSRQTHRYLAQVRSTIDTDGYLCDAPRREGVPISTRESFATLEALAQDRRAIPIVVGIAISTLRVEFVGAVLRIVAQPELLEIGWETPENYAELAEAGRDWYVAQLGAKGQQRKRTGNRYPLQVVQLNHLDDLVAA